MRHRVKGSRLNMRVGHRNSQRRTQVRQLFEYERIQTTVAKAKSIQPDAERLITIAKNALKGDDIAQVNGRRRVAAYLGNNSRNREETLDDFAPRFTNRPVVTLRLLKLAHALE